jgi:hypothetical protein
VGLILARVIVIHLHGRIGLPAEASGILLCVKVVAALLALLIAVIVVADPLCCPDGCSHEGLTGGGTQSRVDCPICHVAAVASATPVGAPTIVQTPASSPSGLLPVQIFHRAVEHPPRPRV